MSTKKVTKKATKTTNKEVKKIDNKKKTEVKAVKPSKLVYKEEEQVKGKQEVTPKKNTEGLKNFALVFMACVIFLGGTFIISDRLNNESYSSGAKTTTTDNSDEESSTTSNPLLEDGEVITDEEKADLVEINWDQYMDMYKGTEKTVVFLGSDTCGWCTYQKPILQKVMKKYGIVVPYYDVSTMTDDQYNELVEQNSALKGFGTPTFITVSNSKITTVESGARGTTELIELLTQEGIIK